MHFSTRVFLVLSIFFFSPTVADPRSEVAGYVCGASNATNEPDFYTNFVSVMENLSNLIADQQWGYYSVTSPSPPVYGFADCHNDLSFTDCQLCFAEARMKLPRCMPAKKGRVYLEGCFVRYDEYDFFEEILKLGDDSEQCGPVTEQLMDRNTQLKFSDRVEMAVKIVTGEMLELKNSGFGTAEVSTGEPDAYALGQCWNTLNSTGCRICMEDAWDDLKKCLPGAEGRALNAGCYVRYSSQKFYVENNAFVKAEKDISQFGWIIGAIGGCALLVLVSSGGYIWYGKFSKTRQDRKKLGQLPAPVKKSHLNFSYGVLEQATDYFDPSNKLGQGGSSSVFKGTLPDGRTVAVKRLFFNTRQWVDNFFNEVNLINGIEHKNLVKLLGCSIEGPESLLVYEFIPNRTLGQVLFDRNRTRTVSFEQRFAIILGIAEGLAFLHEGSHGKIIHRDIKSSNVLLDEDLNPKIADFGLARCAGADKTHISTAVAGTLGYMAPEYILRGQLTEKADVYAFGVLAIETACGRKNNTYDDSDSVLQDVWSHFKRGETAKVVESSVKGGDFDDKRVAGVLVVGLLCTQSSAARRPSMSQVVKMLTLQSDIPLPKQPPFLNASILAASSTSPSASMDTTTSSEHTTIDIFHSTTSLPAVDACPESDETSMIEAVKTESKRY